VAILQEEAARGKLDKDLVDLFVSQRVYDGILGREAEIG
jgi:hypothetical protein